MAKKHGWLCLCGCASYNSGLSRGRSQNRDKATYGRGSTSGAYGRSSYSFESATFDGLPAIKRRLSGKTEFFYGVNVDENIDLNDCKHGHAVIRNGKLVYKRRPGEELPVVNKL